jgi:hypothetical protein
MANPTAIPALKDLNFGTMQSSALCRYLDVVVANEAAAAGAGVAYMTPSKSGPVAPLYSVNAQRLPVQTATIINMIKRNDDRVYNLTLNYWHKTEAEAWATENKAKLKAIENFKKSDPSFDKNLRVYTTYSQQLKTATAKEKPRLVRELQKMDNEGLTPSTPGAMRSWHQNDGGFLPIRALRDTDIDGASDKAKMYHKYIVENIGLQNKQKKKGVAQVYTGYIEYQVGGWSQAIQDGRVCYDYYGDKFYFTATHYQQREGRETMNPWWHVNI